MNRYVAKPHPTICWCEKLTFSFPQCFASYQVCSCTCWPTHWVAWELSSPRHLYTYMSGTWLTQCAPCSSLYSSPSGNRSLRVLYLLSIRTVHTDAYGCNYCPCTYSSYILYVLYVLNVQIYLCN